MAEKDNRSTQIHLRLAGREAARIRTLAASRGLTMSAYVRRVALDGKPPPAPAADAGQLRSLLETLRRSSNNVNQIARAINTRGLEGATPAAIRASLDELDHATRAISSALVEARGNDAGNA